LRDHSSLYILAVGRHARAPGTHPKTGFPPGLPRPWNLAPWLPRPSPPPQRQIVGWGAKRHGTEFRRPSFFFFFRPLYLVELFGVSPP